VASVVEDFSAFNQPSGDPYTLRLTLFAGEFIDLDYYRQM